MGFYTDELNKVKAKLDEQFGINRNIIEGSAAGAEREANANMAISASRGGYLTSPLYDTLLTKNSAVFNRNKNEALLKLAADKAGQDANVAAQETQAKLQDATAENAMWGNVISGAGSTLGAVLGAFGGPGGVAAGASTGGTIAKGLTNALDLGNQTSNFRVPSVSLTNY